MRAPQPVRKMEALEEQTAHPAGKIQFAATILKNGQLDSIAVLKGATSVTAQAAVRAEIEIRRIENPRQPLSRHRLEEDGLVHGGGVGHVSHWEV